MPTIDFNTSNNAPDTENVMDRITRQYRLEHDDLDSSMRSKNFENDIAEHIAEKLQQDNKKAIKAGKATASSGTTAFDTNEQTKFYKDQLGKLIKNVHGMSRDQLEVQKNRMDVLLKTLGDSDTKEKEFLMVQYKQSQEFLKTEYDRRNSLKERGGELLKEARNTFLNFESASMALVGNNPLGAMVVSMGANYFKRQDKKKKDEKILVERDLHRQHMAIKTEEDKVKSNNAEKKRKEELDQLSGDIVRDEQAKLNALIESRPENGYDSLMVREEPKLNDTIAVSATPDQSIQNTSNAPLFVKEVNPIEANISNSVDSTNRAEEIVDLQDEKKDRKNQQSYYSNTLKWQKSITKLLTGGSGGLNVGNGSGVGGITGGSSDSGGGSGIMDAVLGSSVVTAVTTQFQKIKDGTKKFFKGKVGRRATFGLLGGGALTSAMMGGDAEAGTDPDSGKPISVNKRIEKNRDDVQSDILMADGVATVGGMGAESVAKSGASTALKSGAKGVSKFVPGVGALVDAGFEYSDGGSAGSAMTVGGGALAGMSSGGMLGASIGSIFPGVGTTIGGVLGGAVGGIAGAFGASELFGDSDKEKQNNLISRDLDDRGIIDRNDLLPGEDSVLLKPEKLNELAINKLQALLSIDDFNEEDTKLIQKTIKEKSKVSKEKPKVSQKKQDRNNEQSLTGNRQAIDGILTQIGEAESNNNYDAEWGGGKFGDRGSKKLTEMTMGEVKAYQKEMINTQKGMGKGVGQRSSALGKFQFISSSMKEAQEMSGLSDDDLYSEENQDKMGEMWLRKRGGLDKFMKSKKTGKDADRFQNKVAGQWASMKNTQGRGAYDGDGMNTARHSVRGNIDAIALNGSLETKPSPTTKIVSQIDSTNQEIKEQNEAKSNAPVVVSNSVANNSSSGGGGNQGNGMVGSARNNESSLQRITDRYISSGLA